MTKNLHTETSDAIFDNGKGYLMIKRIGSLCRNWEILADSNYDLCARWEELSDFDYEVVPYSPQIATDLVVEFDDSSRLERTGIGGVEQWIHTNKPQPRPPYVKRIIKLRVEEKNLHFLKAIHGEAYGLK